MILLDALPTKDREVIGAIEVLDALIVLVAQETLYAVLVLEVQISQDGISLHDLIQDIEVQRQFIYTLHPFHQLPAYGTSHPKAVMQRLKALRAKSMTAMYQDPGNSLPNIKIVSTIIAEVEPSRSVIALNNY